MHFETLYQEAKWKKQYQQQLEESKHAEIKQLSEIKKMNPHSAMILATKVYENLADFED